MGNCSSTSNCNPCGPNYDAINQLATKAGAYARQANRYSIDAANSATNAEGFANDAQNTWLEFNALYLGAFAAAPTTDNEGNPLQVGALYWNTVSNDLFVWDGASWLFSTTFNEFTPFLATGTTTARNLVTREADVINVFDFIPLAEQPAIQAGTSTYNCTTDIQAAINAAANSLLFIPSGIYILDPLTINSPVHVIMTPTTMLRQRTGATAKNLITINGAGTVINGGIIDGDRNALESSYVYRNPYQGCIGIYINADDVHIQNVKFDGWIDLPLYWFSGDNGTARDLIFENGCYGPMFGPHYSAGSESTTFVENLFIEGITIDGIDNGTTAQINHALDVNRLKASTINSLKLKNLGGNTSSASAFVSGLTSHQCWNCSFSDISATSWNTLVLRQLAVSILSCESCIFSDMTLSGFNHGGLEVLSCVDCDFIDAIIDGQYVVGPSLSYGVTISQGGIGGATFQERSSVGSIGCKFRSIHVQRCTNLGWDIKSSLFTSYDCLSIGNLGHGVFIDDIAAGSSGFVIQPKPNCNATFFNFISRFNGSSGISINDSANVTISGGNFNNNKSNSGITQAATSNGRISISNANCSDNQGATFTNECSYVPGTSDSNNRFQVILTDNDKYSVGQTLTIAGNTGYIYDFNDDVATLQYSSPVLFPEPALTSIGNITTSGTTITSTVNLQSLIPGPIWIKANGEWRRIIQLTGASTGMLESAFSSNLSGVSGSMLLDNITTIKSQSYGIFTTGTASPLFLKNIVATGNLILGIRASTGNFDPSSDVYISRTNTVTGPTIHELTFDAPLNSIPKAIYIKIDSDITGGATGANIVWRRGGLTVHTEDITFTSLLAGTTVNFASTAPTVNLAGTRVALQFTGGSGTGGSTTCWVYSENAIVQI